MLYMIVDALDADGTLIASYPITLDDVAGQSVSNDDFIELAKENRQNDGRELADVTDWQVREPSELDSDIGPGEQIQERASDNEV